MQPIGESTGEAPEEKEEYEEEEKDKSMGEIAKTYLNRPDTDKTFGVVKKINIIISVASILLSKIMILLLKKMVIDFWEHLASGN